MWYPIPPKNDSPPNPTRRELLNWCFPISSKLDYHLSIPELRRTQTRSSRRPSPTIHNPPNHSHIPVCTANWAGGIPCLPRKYYEIFMHTPLRIFTQKWWVPPPNDAEWSVWGKLSNSCSSLEKRKIAENPEPSESEKRAAQLCSAVDVSSNVSVAEMKRAAASISVCVRI